jgi:predicted acylesterase/phospholipase RssA
MTDDAIAKVQVSVTRQHDYDSEMLGAIHEAVLASAAIPEVFPAVKIGNYHYVDGGIINNIPTCKIQEIDNYEHIYIILCNEDTKTKKRSWTKLGRALKAINETGSREAHQIKESDWNALPNVTVIQPPPYRSHLLEWSTNNSLITHAYNHTIRILKR